MITNAERRALIKYALEEAIEQGDFAPDMPDDTRARIMLAAAKHEAVAEAKIANRLALDTFRLVDGMIDEVRHLMFLVAAGISDPSDKKEALAALADAAKARVNINNTGTRVAGDNVVKGDQHIGDKHDSI